MNMIAKKLSITLLTAVTALAPLTVTTANAGERGWRDDGRGQSAHQRDNRRSRGDRGGHRIDRRGGNEDAIVLGIIGLGVGALIGGAIANSQNNPQVIHRSAPSYYEPAPRAVSGGNYEPWSRSWMQYCSSKYRSFNASTGTYRGYDGQDHFCIVN